MADENNEQGTENQAQAQEQAAAGESELEKAQRHALEAQKREQKTKDELAAYKAEQKKLKKEAEDAKLFEQGELKTLLSKKEAEFKAALAERDSQILKRDLRDKLRSEVKNPFELDIFLDWAADRFQGSAEDIPEYIQGLKDSESTASRFVEPEIPPAAGHQAHAAASVKGASAPMQGWAQIQAALKSGDPAKVKEAAKAAESHYLKTGELPK